jgi:hypothetical protein
VPDYLAEAIEILHAGMVDEQDPDAIATVSQCLTQLTRLQAKRSQGGGAAAGAGLAGAGGARGALLSQLQGQI